MYKTKKPNLIIVAILTTITVFGWIFFEVYRKINDAPLKTINQNLLNPISTNLDANALNRIKDGIHLTDEEIDQNSEANNQIKLEGDNQETLTPAEEEFPSENITPTTAVEENSAGQ